MSFKSSGHSCTVYSSHKATHPNIYQWMMGKQMGGGVLHTAEYYSVMKRNGVLTHVTTEMNCKNIMLNGKSQSQKAV